jgi:D-glycero-D-manno-heptose 1,7-bisphosphate phosphatase
MSIRLFFAEPCTSVVKPAVFLDRDGVINERIRDGYVTEWAQFQFLPGMVEAIAALSTLGPPIIVVSNQAAVGKQLLSRRVLGQITKRFVHALRQKGARIDAVYYCPHRSEMGCCCRKPKPGLLADAARDWALDLTGSVLVGDSSTDIDAAAAAGCNSILFARNQAGPDHHPARPIVVRSVAGLFSAVAGLLGSSEGSANVEPPALPRKESQSPGLLKLREH